MKDINLFKAKDSIFLKKITSKSEISDKDNSDGYFIYASEKEARRIIDSLKGKNKIIAFLGGEDNRRAVETLKIDYLVSPERGFRKDTLKQRDSGVNHVIAKEAAKRKISFVVDFSEISGLDSMKKSLRIGKIIQNIKVCRRAKCKIKVASFASDKRNVVDEKGLVAFGVSLGMSSEQGRNSVNFK